MLSKIMQTHQVVDPSKMRAPDFLKAQDEMERNAIQAVQSGSGWRVVPACPVCGAMESRPEFKKHSIEYVCCLKCETRYTTQIPAQLDDIYNDAAYRPYTLGDTDEQHYQYRRERFGRERVGILERYCGDLTDKFILDVGCGNGYFLSVAMEKCRHCFGTEFSEKLRDFTQRKTGLTVYNRRLEELPALGFDIITLFDVIEHIPDPLPFMRAIDRILRPGGSILIFTPNFDSFSIRVMREYSSIAVPTEHIVLYTLPSLHFLADKLGYTVVYEETQGLDVVNVLSMQQLKRESQNDFLMEWNNELQAMINASKCGDYGRILFRKN
jgi:2-polyprenyl-3-methyl-5-hydroxy-6-metoxy-1,4-benzoquinol methylase